MRSLCGSVAVAFLLMSFAGCGGSFSDGISPTTGEVAAGQAVTYEPSPQALADLSSSAIDAYRLTGVKLGLDWTILAATDMIETGRAASSDDGQRAESIGYTLLATGAPGNYQTALQARGGSLEFAQRVLSEADRYRGAVTGQSSTPTPVSTDPLVLPSDGQVVANFGQGFGVLHNGIDIEDEAGAPIQAIAPGTVLSTGFTAAYGNYTCILHRFKPPINEAEQITSCYGNQAEYETTPGSTVAAGETIGRIGCSGPCLRPHVHFEILLGTGPDGEAVDPAPFFDGRLGGGTGRSLEG